MPKQIENIGEVLKEAVKRGEWGLGKEIAEKLGKRHIGDIGKRQDIGCNELVVFCDALGVNFFEMFLTAQDFTDLCKKHPEPGEVRGLKEEIEKYKFQIKHLMQCLEDKQNIIRDKEKLIELLETKIGALEDQSRKSA